MMNVGCSMSPGLMPGAQPYLQQAGMSPGQAPASHPMSGGTVQTAMPPASPPLSMQPSQMQYASGPSMRDLLAEYLGHYIRTEHLVGTGSLVNHEGRLIRVCENAFVLEEQQTGFHQVCDYYSLKFFREL